MLSRVTAKNVGDVFETQCRSGDMEGKGSQNSKSRSRDPFPTPLT